MTVAAQRLALCPARRYAAVCGVLVGGMRQRHFDGTHSKPHKVLENAPRSVPPVGCTLFRRVLILQDIFAISKESLFRVVALFR